MTETAWRQHLGQYVLTDTWTIYGVVKNVGPKRFHSQAMTLPAGTSLRRQPSSIQATLAEGKAWVETTLARRAP